MYILPLNDICLPRSEVLRYLGYSGQPIENSLISQIDLCINEIYSYSKPKCVYSVFDVKKAENGICLGDELLLTGNDIKGLLNNCEQAVLFAATLGCQIDSVIRLNQELDAAKSVILNAAATALIEAYCENIEKQLMSLLQLKSITMRFSCGYGDLPLDIQPLMLKVLNAQKLIGLTVTSGGIMLPKKSVTAVFGINKNNCEISHNDNKCKSCKSVDCPFRKD